MIFQLTWATYDCSIDYFFDGPDGVQEDFQKLCDELMREVTLRTLALEGDKRHKSWIGYSYLVDEVAKLLPSYGYEKINFKKAEYLHGCIFRYPGEDLGSDNQKVLGDELETRAMAYNAEMREAMEGIIKANTPVRYTGNSGSSPDGGFS